jgi:FtsP/CotA-like multicopper oxidase with cupredoxin domain
MSRRTVFKAAGAGIGLYFLTSLGGRAVAFEAASPRLRQMLVHTADVTKFVSPLLIPPAMPRAGTVPLGGFRTADYYEISVRQFAQQILPQGLPATTVWGYGPAGSAAVAGNALHNAPSLTIEAEWNRPVRVRWINELTKNGQYLPHLLPVDPTLHWANPGGGAAGRDSRPVFSSTPERYTGPVPLVTHVHGSVGVGDESDGYPEAWFLPAASDIPPEYARHGSWYRFFANKAFAAHHVSWRPGSATFHYPNAQRASTLWYHDHTLGMTRLNVYAGPAGFFLIRGGPEGDGAVIDRRTGRRAVLPGPAPRRGDPATAQATYREIPIAIQDRSFNADGSLFYPDSREFFGDTVGPWIPDTDIPPIWNPEFFGSAIMVNGRTWPFLTVERRRYRFRALNGCDARFLILDFTDIPGVEVWQIGSEGGFLPKPVNLQNAAQRLLLAPAERADIIVDFTAVPQGWYVLRNVGPDEPFGGGEPDTDFDRADGLTTGQVMQFRVVPAVGPDRTTPPAHLLLPAVTPLRATRTRRLALIEDASTVQGVDAPIAALLGTVDNDGNYAAAMWDDPLSENPAVGATETWELYNTTADAHPMHVHDVFFQVVNRQPVLIDEIAGTARPDPAQPPRAPEPAEKGWKDAVITYPGEVTRIRVRFGKGGQFVWHCHIVEHEDNEMMRPLRVGPVQPGQPGT